MNSWHRMPFLSSISSVPGASYYPQLSETSGVFGIGNYGASQVYDNDDGSSFDHTHDNYFTLSDGFKVSYVQLLEVIDPTNSLSNNKNNN